MITKVFTTILIVIVFATTLIGCTNRNSNVALMNNTEIHSQINESNAKEAQKVEFEEGKQLNPNKKILIAYFTRADNIGEIHDVDAISEASQLVKNDNGRIIGNMEILARYIQNDVGGDLFSIQTVESYSQDFNKSVEEARSELKANARPELSTYIDNIDDYDVIYLGYPNWWETIPMAVATFLESYNFSGKTIIPFASGDCGTGGLGDGVIDIKKLATGATVIEDGFEVLGAKIDNNTQNDIDNWLKDINQME